MIEGQRMATCVKPQKEEEEIEGQRMATCVKPQEEEEEIEGQRMATCVKSQEEEEEIEGQRPLNAAYNLSPMAVPYLNKAHTPKTLLKLQEEHRTRTKGKLISLTELRNARSAYYTHTHTHTHHAHARTFTCTYYTCVFVGHCLATKVKLPATGGVLVIIG